MSSRCERQGPPSEDARRVSRRHFLQGVAASAGAAAVSEGGLLGATSPAPAQAASAAIGPGATMVTLQVNGQERQLEIEPRVTLLNALRDHLDVKTGNAVDLTGAKKVCDRSSCGACTVIVDGRTAYSCTMLAVEAAGKSITTVEGLGTAAAPHAVQEAFVECDGLMCGFCTPGFVVAAKQLLDDNPFPTLEEIKRGLNGNICRCGTYYGIFDAVKLASMRQKGG